MKKILLFISLFIFCNCFSQNRFAASNTFHSIYTVDGALSPSSSSSDSVWVRYASTGITKLRAQADIGVSTKFGKDDVTASETRAFNAAGNDFNILHSSTFEISAQSAKTKAVIQAYSTNWIDHYATSDSTTSAYAGFAAKSAAGTGGNTATIGAFRTTGQNLTVEISDTAIKAAHSSGTLPIYLNGLPDQQKDTVLNYSPATGKVTYHESLMATGSYEPTLTSVTNVTATTSYSTTKWYKVGDMVTVYGKFQVDPTSPGATEVGMSLPIASDFTGDDDAAGTASSSNLSGEVLSILADATNNRARIVWSSTDTSNRTVFFHFSYKIIPL